MLEKLLKEVTKDWTEADWESTSEDKLRYYIGEFLEEQGNPRESAADLFLLKFEFERYMGW